MESGVEVLKWKEGGDKRRVNMVLREDGCVMGQLSGDELQSGVAAW